MFTLPTPVFEGNENDPLQLQISSLDYDDYIGRLGIGRVNKGKIKTGQISKNIGLELLLLKL